MANQPETATYDAGVYQIEIVDAVVGGVGGIINMPLLNLADRTKYLKQHVDNIESGATSIPGAAPLASPTFTGTPTAPTPLAGDNSTKIATTAFVDTALFGISSVNVAGGANVTLTQAQFGPGIIVLTGALTASINVVFPVGGNWIVSNQTTGAFTLTCKTAAGTGVLVAQGKTSEIFADGTNIQLSRTDFTNLATPSAGDNSTNAATTAFVNTAIYGISTVSVAGGANVTLTQAQFGPGIVTLTGAITANINVVFPVNGNWIVNNQTTGAFSITCKTTGGTGVVVTQGKATEIFGDGTNIGTAGGGGFSASGQTLVSLLPLSNEPPSTNFAQIAFRNGHPALEFDTTTQWAAVWTAVMPQSYSNTTGITVFVTWMAASATSGTIGWTVEIERMDPATNLTADSFATAATIVAATVPGTSGLPKITSIAITKGANMDSVVAGDTFRIRIKRDVANDTAAGNAEILSVEIRET